MTSPEPDRASGASNPWCACHSGARESRQCGAATGSHICVGGEAASRRHSVPTLCLLALIRAYRLALSPFFGGHCRFHPTCSAYALEAVQRFGAAHGSWLTLRRLGRCHPWHPGGFDPVPERRASQ